MSPQQLSLFCETSSAMRLMRAASCPYVVSFLYERFKQSPEITCCHSELIAALAGFQERLRESGLDALQDRPEEYLRDWSTEKQWLLRFLEAGRNEAMYQLTPHSEAALRFFEEALRPGAGFVGTESRLRLVIQTLEELVIGSSDDPELRLAHLREERDRIAREIAEIEQNGTVNVFGPTRIREQFALAVGLLRQLQGDFRAVEERFKEITRAIQQRQAQGNDSRSGILAEALDAEDELKNQDQGISFFEFLRFIQSPDQQDRLQRVIVQLSELQELADQAEGLEIVRYMVRGLLDEAEKVLQTLRRLSASLRRLLDSRTQYERQRIADVLRRIRQLAAGLSDAPPTSVGAEIDDSIRISSPIARTNWSPPVRFVEAAIAEHVADDEERKRAFRDFGHLKPIDWRSMRRHIRDATLSSGRCTLAELLKLAPPRGLVDVLGYLQIAFDDQHLIRLDATEELVVQRSDAPHRPAAMMSVTVPLVTFLRRER
jgi:chorismate mutase